MIGVESMLPKTPPLVMVKVPPVISSRVISPSRTRIASLLISCSTPAKPRPSAFRITGTIRPFGPLTAMEMSQYPNSIMSLPSIMEFTPGYICRARTQALVKKDMNPRPTSCFSLKASLCCLRRSKIGFMSTSLKVVSMAVSFFTETRRLERLLLRLLMRLRSLGRSASLGALPMLATACTTSSLVTRPSRPLPFDTEVPVSAIIFRAAGEAVPVAYVAALGAAAGAADAGETASVDLVSSLRTAPPSGASASVSMIQTT